MAKKPKKARITEYVYYAKKDGLSLSKNAVTAHDYKYELEGSIYDIVVTFQEILIHFPTAYLEQTYTYDYYNDRAEHYYACVDREETDEEQDERLGILTKQQAEQEENEYKTWLVLKKKFGEK